MRIHNDVPTEGQVYEYLSRYSPEQYQKIYPIVSLNYI